MLYIHSPQNMFRSHALCTNACDLLHTILYCIQLSSNFYTFTQNYICLNKCIAHTYYKCSMFVVQPSVSEEKLVQPSVSEGKLAQPNVSVRRSWYSQDSSVSEEKRVQPSVSEGKLVQPSVSEGKLYSTATWLYLLPLTHTWLLVKVITSGPNSMCTYTSTHTLIMTSIGKSTKTKISFH